jgi:hypothetical protein
MSLYGAGVTPNKTYGNMDGASVAQGTVLPFD